MEKMLYFVAGSPLHGLYSGYLHGIRTKSGRDVLHLKRRLHLIHPMDHHLIGNSICHTIHG